MNKHTHVKEKHSLLLNLIVMFCLTGVWSCSFRRGRGRRRGGGISFFDKSSGELLEELLSQSELLQALPHVT